MKEENKSINPDNLRTGMYDVFCVLGNSMEPNFEAGTLVCAEKVKKQHWCYLDNTVVAVVHRDKKTMLSNQTKIGRIKTHNLKDINVLRLSTDNPSVSSELSFVKSEIMAIFRVMYVCNWAPT